MQFGWRLVKASRAATAFDGEGAFLNGGRWNSPGRRVVYTSATLSLAALETLVHLSPAVPLRYAAFQVEFDDNLIETVAAASLRKGWRAEPPGIASMRIGDSWIAKSRTAVLAVPSVIVPGENNYLINVSHPDYNKISIGKPKAFAFDPRLLSENL